MYVYVTIVIRIDILATAARVPRINNAQAQKCKMPQTVVTGAHGRKILLA